MGRSYGCHGTVSSHGWEALTNFLIDVYTLINSCSTYKLKGRLLSKVVFIYRVLKKTKKK